VQINAFRKHAFQPQKVVTYEAFVRTTAAEVMGSRAPVQGPVRVTVEASFSIPWSWPAWRQDAARKGQVAHTKKPDLDNIQKAVLDGMNAIVWRDDSCVVEVIASKTFKYDRDFVIVQIEALPLAPCQGKRDSLKLVEMMS
jgi:Holliday junction resolvase RusA-like endonuclease